MGGYEVLQSLKMKGPGFPPCVRQMTFRNYTLCSQPLHPLPVHTLIGSPSHNPTTPQTTRGLCGHPAKLHSAHRQLSECTLPPLNIAFGESTYILERSVHAAGRRPLEEVRIQVLEPRSLPTVVPVTRVDGSRECYARCPTRGLRLRRQRQS